MEYRVLARKYRPAVFADLIGQDVLVRTLTNAIKAGRVAHAFLLTGIRGVGKTTTARILARAFNCVGEDGQGGPTVAPCGVCEHCRMIAEDRHMDVVEMDAASHNGVADIRELTDATRYRPASARYKVYIIDEVHMLSAPAFNALLKTLEEPPPHVKFIFATTELRKIPVTILSRCQRFDLKRVSVERLTEHLSHIAKQESVSAGEEALRLIATAAEGSVRDALSLLDQAIAHSAEVKAEAVRAMLGLADRSRAIGLLEKVFAGDAQASLLALRELYEEGADPLMVLQDCLELVHFITRIKLIPEVGTDPAYGEDERKRSAVLAQSLGMAAISRAWQMLLKGIGEVRVAPVPLAAAEMVLVRLAHAAELPSPAELVRTLRREGSAASAAAPREIARAPEPTGAAFSSSGNLALAASSPPAASTAARPHLALVTAPAVRLESFEEMVTLFETHRESLLATHLKHHCRLVKFARGVIEIAPEGDLPRDFAVRVGGCLERWTGEKWRVVLSQAGGAPTLHAQAEERRAQEHASASAHPLVASVLAHFPGAEIKEIRTIATPIDTGEQDEFAEDA